MKNRKGIISFVLSLVLILTTNKFVNAYNDEHLSKDASKQIESQQIENYNEKELNSTSEATTNIGLNSTIYGTTSKYSNYFKFTTNSDGYIDLNFNRNENVRFEYHLLDINRNQIDHFNTSYGNSYGTLRKGLPKGTYYVKVSKYSTSDPDTQYSFSVKHTETNTFEKEFNNEPSSANNINLNMTYSGITDDYYDYFKFTTNSDGYIDLNFNRNENVRFEYHLLDINRNQIDHFNTSYGNSHGTLRKGHPKGTYYVKVSKYSTSDPDTQYSFSVKHTATNTFEKEFNNGPSSANNINLNMTYLGITDDYYDYFKFTINSKQDIEIKISKNENVRYKLELLDINRNTVAKITTQNGTGYDSLKQNLSSGTYYVKVSKYSTSDPDTQYSFSVNNSTQNGWVKVNDKWYYYLNGVKKTGWLNLGGKWYYLKSSGQMATGWQAVGGKWYYLKANGQMATGWQAVGGKWYYLKANGQMATGWQAIGRKWYYLNANGEMATGWKLINSSWYYLNLSGEMATGWKPIGGSWYYLNTNGKMATNTTIDGWKIGSNGVATPIK